MLPGIDVSNWQGEIDWHTVAKSGVRFAYIKATEGATYQDPRFGTNRAGATEAGIAAGAYHYLRTTSTIPDQVQNFVNIVHALLPGDLPPALDIEDPKQWSGKTRTEIAAFALSWLDGIEEHLGTTPIIYLSPSFAESFLDPASAQLAAYPLWVAHWNAEQPRIPEPWQRAQFWQHSSTGRVPGIHEKVDLDWFTGEDADLRLMRV
jgi:lysozyme